MCVIHIIFQQLSIVINILIGDCFITSTVHFLGQS